MGACVRNTAEKGWKRKKGKRKERKVKKEFFLIFFYFFILYFFEGDGFALSFFIFLNEKEYERYFKVYFHKKGNGK